MPLESRHLNFDPARDGFAFANHFRWTEADLAALTRLLRPLSRTVAVTLPALGGWIGGRRVGALGGAVAGGALAAGGFGDPLVRGVAQRWPSFGLCGGMALAAAERWPLAAGLPTAALKERHVRPLLWRAQERTLRAAAPTFLRYWLPISLVPSYTPEAPFATDFLRAWDAIRARIDAGRPALLGLVGDAPDPFGQHQVLAVGYDRLPGGGRLVVYDPNSPGRTHAIEFAVHQKRVRFRTDLRTGRGPSGRAHISTRPGHLGMVFHIDA